MRFHFSGIERLALRRAHALAHLRAERVDVDSRARDAEDRELVGKMPGLGEVVDRRQELPARQIAGRAEDHEDARRQRGGSTWPPNCARSAESSFSANV